MEVIIHLFGSVMNNAQGEAEGYWWSFFNNDRSTKLCLLLKTVIFLPLKGLIVRNAEMEAEKPTRD